MSEKKHDHACINCFTGSGPCAGNCNIYDENRALAAGVMQEYFPNGGRDFDHILSLYDAIYTGKIPGLSVPIPKLTPPRAEMLEYVKAAIGEGYQPENEAAITDLSLIDTLNDHDLNREFGKCWQWYNMGGGLHETFEAAQQKNKTEDDYRRDHLYNMKLQCLHAVLVQRGVITEGEAKMIAKMVNAGFNEITF